MRRRDGRHGATKLTPVLASSATATSADIQAALTQLLATSKEAPGMQIVKADDPQNSYLMHKLDGSQACAGTCTKHPGARRGKSGAER